MSRPRPSAGGQFRVATWVLRSRHEASCLGMSRPVHAQHARDMRTLCARPGRVCATAHAMCAQCTRPDLLECTVLSTV